MSINLFVALLAGGIAAGTPILYACLGEVIAERSGVINLGVEGMMLVGAVSAYAVALHTGNIWLAQLMAMLSAGALARVPAQLVIGLRANQVASGLALTIFGTGIAAYFGKGLVGLNAPHYFDNLKIPALSNIPYLGTLLFRYNLLVYISFLLVVATWFVLFKTKTGLLIRAVGENPAAADAQGHNVFLTRTLCVLAGGMLAGMGGAFLSIAYARGWQASLVNGRGWIAVALVIFAVWSPGRALLGAWLFGVITAMSPFLQTLGFSVPAEIYNVLPYIFTFIVLVLTTSETRHRRSGTPGMLGVPYAREER